MLISRTHFEQIPLEAVYRIVEEQAAGEIASKPDPETAKKELEKDLVTARISTWSDQIDDESEN